MSAISTIRRAGIALCLGVALSACATEVRFGEGFDETALTRFEIGKTTRADVIATLGPPRGRGQTLEMRLGEPREMLFYELVASDMNTVDLKFLLIILDGDLYDGHFWFASRELVDETGF